MNKVTAALMISVFSAAAGLAGATVVPAVTHAKVTPVVSVIALSAAEAEALATLRSEYRTRKVAIDSEYAARMDAILVKAADGNS